MDALPQETYLTHHCRRKKFPRVEVGQLVPACVAKLNEISPRIQLGVRSVMQLSGR